MRKVVWMQQPGVETFAGGQQLAFRQALEASGYQVLMQRYQPRSPSRLQCACDWLIWSFVPTQLDVWSAKLFARRQMGVIYELPVGRLALPQLKGWCVPSESLRMQLIDSGISHERVCMTAGYLPAPVVSGLDEKVKKSGPLIYVGASSNSFKGKQQALWALSILQYLHPQSCMVFHTDRQDQERLLKMENTICAAGSVIWAAEDAEVQAMVQRADMVMLAQQFDGVPDALFSACLAGKPILASQQPSLLEWLKNDANALVVDDARPPVWAAAMDRLISDSGLAERLGRGGRLTGVPTSRVVLPGWMELEVSGRRAGAAA